MSFASAPPRARLGFLMVTLVRQWRRQVEEQLLELAERVGLDGSSLVRLLDILEGHGWVERRADPGDRRSKRIFLTGEGNGAVDRVRATMLQAELAMLQDLDDAEVEAMLAGMAKIQARMAALRTKATP
jgi:MarR family transcriptional regulator for hemolysin